MNNQVINGLWIGNKLSPLEITTIISFQNKGHIFQLWTYELIENLPEQVIIKDANQIIPSSQIFYRNHADPYGIGKGSIALFSDIFRYKLLYEIGGWWVDMDVTCLKKFDHHSPYFFRGHPIIEIVGNVMKAPKGAEVMYLAYSRALAQCNSETVDWLSANKILCQAVSELNLQVHIVNDWSCSDWWQQVEPYLFLNITFPKKWYFIHWMNEEWTKQKLNKFVGRSNTAFGKVSNPAYDENIELSLVEKWQFIIRHYAQEPLNELKYVFWKKYHAIFKAE